MKDVKFWDPETNYFTDKDIEGWAIDTANRGEPGVEETELDKHQKLIVNSFKKHADKANNIGIEALNSAYSDAEKHQQKLQSIETKFAAQTFLHDMKTEINNLNLKYKNDLIDLNGKLIDAEKGRNKFKHNNKLDNRDAAYPVSSIQHFSWIFLLLIGESVGNAYFFAQGSSGGLLGGFFEAIFISSVNVGLSIFIGILGIRYINHVSKLKYVGIVLLLIYLILCPLFNLATAHYRDFIGGECERAIEILNITGDCDDLGFAKEIALKATLPHLSSAPFEITFNGMMLLFIGIVSAVISCRKGYKADDIYPGYGDIDRKYETAYQDVKDLENEFIGEITQLYKKTNEEMKNDITYAQSVTAESKKILHNVDIGIKKWEQSILAINNASNDFLELYRNTNKKIRSKQEPPPDYFTAFPNRFEIAEPSNTIQSWIESNKNGALDSILTNNSTLNTDIDAVFNAYIENGVVETFMEAKKQAIANQKEAEARSGR